MMMASAKVVQTSVTTTDKRPFQDCLVFFFRMGEWKSFAMQNSLNCIPNAGGRLLVDTNVTNFNQSAILVSPLYNRSRDWYGDCLKFRYMLRGPGKKTLSIYWKTKTYREIPIWISNRNTGRNWLYGQVPLNSLSEFQVFMQEKGKWEPDWPGSFRSSDLSPKMSFLVKDNINMFLSRRKDFCVHGLKKGQGFPGFKHRKVWENIFLTQPVVHTFLRKISFL